MKPQFTPVKPVLIWVVYFNRPDFPNQYVAKLFLAEKNTTTLFSNDKLEPVRDWIQEKGWEKGTVPVKLDRPPMEEEHVLEVWL